VSALLITFHFLPQQLEEVRADVMKTLKEKLTSPEVTALISRAGHFQQAKRKEGDLISVETESLVESYVSSS